MKKNLISAFVLSAKRFTTAYDSLKASFVECMTDVCGAPWGEKKPGKAKIGKAKEARDVLKAALVEAGWAEQTASNTLSRLSDDCGYRLRQKFSKAEKEIPQWAVMEAAKLVAKYDADKLRDLIAALKVAVSLDDDDSSAE